MTINSKSDNLTKLAGSFPQDIEEPTPKKFIPNVITIEIVQTGDVDRVRDLVDGLNLEIKTNGVKAVTPWSLMIETFNSLNHCVFSLNERATNVAKSCWRLNDQGNFETKLGFVGSVRAIERAISNLNCFHGLTINFHFETREKFGFKNESITCWFKKGELEVAKRIGLECIEESLSKWGDNVQIRKYGTTTPYLDYEWSEEGALKIDRQNDFYFMSNELSDPETFEHFIKKASTSLGTDL